MTDFPKEVPVTKGEYRFLTGRGEGEKPRSCYDFAVVTKRLKGLDSEKVAVQTTIVDPLVAQGLWVDVIEGTDSTYYIVLVRAPDALVLHFAKDLKLQMWMRCGNARELDDILVNDPSDVDPADRIQAIEYIIRARANITKKAVPLIRHVFPVQDEAETSALMRKYIRSCGRLDAEQFSAHVKTYFGERVAYYFCFLDCYNQSLIPIAIVGVVFTLSRPYLGTAMYMQLLVVWGFFVSVIWSFWFLKRWRRHNSALNFAWKNDLHTKFLLYPNPNFQGSERYNPVTNKMEVVYAWWKRIPVYVFVTIFMVVQIAIMMLFIAAWITTYETFQIRFPDTGFGGVQWFCVLGGGIVFGLFVDVVQWELVVKTMAHLCTQWENWRTTEQFERSLIRKLFFMDFLNIYTWFFLLAFVYVVPGAGDTITNALNSVLFQDEPNCCFGPYLDKWSKLCTSCPPPWHRLPHGGSLTQCNPCKGYVTFDMKHLNLESLFVTPVVVAQLLNLLIQLLVPWALRRRHVALRKRTDQQALAMLTTQDARKRDAAILGTLEYGESTAADIVEPTTVSTGVQKTTRLASDSKAKGLQVNVQAWDALHRVAREVLFQGKQDQYDPYDDYHTAMVQYGFVVMFSMLWPLMPLCCFCINALKYRADGYRLCTKMQRPLPQKAGGIGEWYTMFVILACMGVIVYTGLVFVSTGAVEFFVPQCVAKIKLDSFRFGPSFECFDMSTRLVMILVSENVLFVGAWLFWNSWRSLPKSLEDRLGAAEASFKWALYTDREKTGATPAKHHTTPRSTKPLRGPTEASPLIEKTHKDLARKWDP
ncbi:hypothetical protein H310_10411 [Aphanomyces invadans]|uniref:Anoctamin transmembrane domain-containing protein n=1 Tax=Aphanomyces invadans TaxID=157072 RepID=A0A024TRG3_9STRA|nr:hypothetical protein H310_10411 [Aphanomyces invadans]ETV96221.1 hypothetical protein H310_10411 [Aphanomyces invadans]|eukprot:XP_008875013.1 hypothetical protein H310_10411 [Aphanomyces invadans]